MKRPLLEDDAFLGDLARARGQPDALHAWWLGQSGFLLAWNGTSVLLDPYLSDSLTRKYAATDKPHVRMTGRVVDPARLTGIDIVTSSHNHTDHLDAETLRPLILANPKLAFVIPEANRAFVAERLFIDPGAPVGLDDGGEVEVAGLRLHGLPAAHDTVERDAHGRCRFMGYVVEIGPFRVYHAGDTRWVPGLPERLRAFDLDLALLPISGTLEERHVAGNLWGQEAAALAHAAGARLAVPMHYDLVTFNTESPAAFCEACDRRGQPYRVLQNGERLTLHK